MPPPASDADFASAGGVSQASKLSRVPPRPVLASRYSAVPPVCAAFDELSSHEEVEFVEEAPVVELLLVPALPLFAPAEDEAEALDDAGALLEVAEPEELGGGAVG